MTGLQSPFIMLPTLGSAAFLKQILFTVFARFHARHIEAWVERVEVLGFQLFLNTS